jgi:hypothetical protein
MRMALLHLPWVLFETQDTAPRLFFGGFESRLGQAGICLPFDDNKKREKRRGRAAPFALALAAVLFAPLVDCCRRRSIDFTCLQSRIRRWVW